MRDSSNTGKSRPNGRDESTFKYKMNKDNWRDNSDLKVVLDKIGTEYKVLDRLGEGGYAKVYKVYHRIFEETRILKIMDSEFILHKLAKKNFQERRQLYNEIVQRFMREAQLYSKIDHPNIVKIHEVSFVKTGNNVEVPFFIMPYIRGISLADLLKQKTRLDFNTALRISQDILAALHEIHSANITHRDIKPGNIIIDKLTGKAVLIDFGLAKQRLDETDSEPPGISSIDAISTKDKLIHSNLTSSDQTMGTPQYMPPEQLTRMKDLGPGSDIYSFGVILFEMLTGVVPLGHENLQQPVPDIREFNPSLPRGIQNIISKAMAKKPQDRYKTVKELLNDLEKIKEDTGPIKTAEKDISEQTTEEVKKREKEAKEKIQVPKIKFPVYISILAIIVSIIIASWLIFKPGDSNSHYRELINSANQCIETADYETAKDYLNQSLKIKDTSEIRWLLEMVANKQKEREKKPQIEKMREEHQILKEFLKGSASRDKKIEKCQAFLKTYENIPTTDEIKGMISEINKEKKYHLYIKSVNSYIYEGNYSKAAESLQKAKQLKDSQELKQLSEQIEEAIKREEAKKLEYERINGTKTYDAIKDTMNLEKYLEFIKTYPKSIHQEDLKNRLKTADQSLPPEGYWDKPINKNKKGYYEYRFDPEHNGHLMIYIPDRKFWIDKYEVSNLQFRNFLKAEKQEVPPEDDQKEKDKLPAVVEYEEAVSYCRKYGFRLPTETEWEYAAKGRENIDYPWGNEKPNENDIYRANFDSFDDGFKDRAPVKSFENFSSPFGVVNMAGNVWEWIQRQKLKGGSFFSEIEDLKIEKSISDKRAAPTGFPSGFRCLKQEKGD